MANTTKQEAEILRVAIRHETLPVERAVAWAAGILWSDAHADFNTPETLPSAFLDGWRSPHWSGIVGRPSPRRFPASALSLRTRSSFSERATSTHSSASG